jgi:hypothetical protein
MKPPLQTPWHCKPFTLWTQPVVDDIVYASQKCPRYGYTPPILRILYYRWPGYQHAAVMSQPDTAGKHGLWIGEKKYQEFSKRPHLYV